MKGTPLPVVFNGILNGGCCWGEKIVKSTTKESKCDREIFDNHIRQKYYDPSSCVGTCVTHMCSVWENLGLDLEA